ncbi:hypothetical protein ILUMI_17384 [Ignelater luminosus]|uniref:Uncharacterized protein n=1 Tax=Ignelater luminosus TaxID=2038154 RepID=A0A8K0CJZ0_IGNLU|nr:hypothetical protein ILUMI_17384 [Ignelater luminosus]
MMRTARSKSRRSYDTVPLPDGRERHGPGVKIAENIMALKKKHIDLFPTVPAHWCRKDSKNIYLESILNKEKMYLLYLEFCDDKKIKPVSKTINREILILKNIGF